MKAMKPSQLHMRSLSGYVLLFLLLMLVQWIKADTDMTLQVGRVLDRVNKNIYVILPDNDNKNNNSGSKIDLSALYSNTLKSTLTLMTLSSFPAIFPPALSDEVSCEDLLEEERLDVLNGRKNTRGKIFLVNLQSYEEVAQFFKHAEATTIQFECPLDIRTGVFDRDNVFLFDLTVGNHSDIEDFILSHRLIRRRRFAGVIQTTSDGRKLVLSRHNLYSNANQIALWPTNPDSVSSIMDLFPDFPMSGYRFVVAGLPYDAYFTSDVDPNPPDETRLFVNQSGLEVEMVDILARKLDYSYEFVNSADQQWGAIHDGNWNGMVKQVMNNEADFMISAVGRFLFRRKVLINTVGFIKTRLVFLSSKPKVSHNIFRLLHPLNAAVWACVAVSLLLFPLALWQISKREKNLINESLSHWSTPGQSCWYVFGTLIGESITRDTKSEGAWALRILICVWVMAAFLLTAGYGGMLRSFLLNPDYEAPIDTLEKVLSSGIPWEIGIYGEDVEVQMARSTHPTMEAIWDGRIEVINEAFAFQRMQKIVDGERILIDWMNKLETSMYIGFTLSNGEKLMEYYYLPIVHSHVECVWGFNPFNPHVERFDNVIMTLFEGGLVYEIHYRTRLRLKRQYGSGEVLKKDDEVVSKMTLTDLLGSILFFVTFLPVSVLIFVAEIFLAKRTPKYFSHVSNDHGGEVVGNVQEKEYVVVGQLMKNQLTSIN